MTLEEELRAAESVIQTGQENATQHLERMAGIIRLNETIIDHYRKYLDTTTSVAQSTLEFCRRLVSTSVKSDACPSEDATQVVQGLIVGVLKSMEAMYSAMSVVEQMARQTNAHDSHVRTSQDESHATRRCSFCGATEEAGKVVAGPSSNICARCTRLACGVLGITLQP